MDLELEGKIIIVSGGARGIGEGITNLLAAEGAIPIIIGRSEENVDEEKKLYIEESGLMLKSPA